VDLLNGHNLALAAPECLMRNPPRERGPPDAPSGGALPHPRVNGPRAAHRQRHTQRGGFGAFGGFGGFLSVLRARRSDVTGNLVIISMLSIDAHGLPVLPSVAETAATALPRQRAGIKFPVMITVNTRPALRVTHS
jgi:hypothetical protein